VQIGLFIIGVFVAAVIGSITSARGAVASHEWLAARAEIIGTKNPRLARAVCIAGAFVFTAFWVGILAHIINVAITGGPAEE